jgi:hypothetical protein
VSVPVTQPIEDWLARIGLEQHAAGFSRQSSGKCWISTRTSASVLSVVNVGMMIVRVTGETSPGIAA